MRKKAIKNKASETKINQNQMYCSNQEQTFRNKSHVINPVCIYTLCTHICCIYAPLHLHVYK